MNTAICTVFEGHHHLGAGALINSLHRAGFQGCLWAGYRGALPPWAGSAQPEENNNHRLEMGPGFSAIFVPLATSLHFAYYKPTLLDRTLNEFAPDADAAIYLDPDIVVKCPRTVFPRWLTGGVAVVEDINPNLPAHHPQRNGWAQVLEKKGLRPQRNLERYYNSGFIGITRDRAGFLKLWQQTMEVVLAELGPHHHIKFGQATDLFHSTDQDALNMACMLTDIPLAAAGPEAMDFAVGGHYLSHAVGTPKPWEGGFVSRALRGYPPSSAARSYMDYLDTPLIVMTASRRKSLARSVKLAALISRFYRRS